MAPQQQAPPPAPQQQAPPPIDLSDPNVAAAYAQLLAGGTAQGAGLYDNPGGYADPTAQVFTGTAGAGAAPKYSRVTKGWVGRNGTDPSFLIPYGDQNTQIQEDKDGAIRSRYAKDDPNLSLVDVGYNPATGQWEVLSSAQTATAADNTTTVEDVLKSFYKMDGAEMARTQRVLFAGGFYGGAKLADIQFGVPDEASFAAFARATTRAVRMYGAGEKVTVDDVLAQAARAGGIGATAGSGPGGQINLTNPADLNALLENTAMAVLGHGISDDEKKMFVSLVHQVEQAAGEAAGGGQAGTAAVPYSVINAPSSEERTAQQLAVAGGDVVIPDQPRGSDVSLAQLQAANPTPAAPGGTVVAPPSAATQAAEFLKTAHPLDVQENDIIKSGGMLDAFRQMLSGWLVNG